MKYFIQKFCFGVIFLYFGFSEKIDSFINQAVDTSSFINNVILAIKAVIYIVFMFAFIMILVLTFAKKSEVEDELARKNIFKAQSLVYFLLLITSIIYAIVEGCYINLNISLDYKIIEIVLGICQIFEYLFFMNFERKSDFYE